MNNMYTKDLQDITQLLDQAPYGIFTVDRALRVRFWNLWLAQRSRLSASQVLGHSLLDIYPDLHERNMERHFRTVLDTGQPVVLSHRLHHHLLPLPSTSGQGPIPQTVRLLPWRRDTDVIGVIAFIEDLSEQVSVETELRQRIALLDTLRRMDQIILSGHPLGEALQMAVEQAVALTAAICTGLFIAYEGQPELRALAGESSGKLISKRAVRQACARVMATGETEQISVGRGRTYKLLIVPISPDDKTRGTLCLAAAAPATFADADRRTAERLAEEIALAIQHEHLRERDRERVRTLTLLHHASLALTRGLDPQSVLDELVRYAVRLVRATHAHVWLYDEKRDQLVFGSGPGLPGSSRGPISKPRSNGLTYAVARQGRTIIVNDPEHHPLYGPDVARRKQIKAIIGLPIKTCEHVLGVLTVTFTHPHMIDEWDERLLRLLVEQTSNAIVNTQLHGSLQEELKKRQAAESALRRRVTELDALVRLSRKLAATLKVEDLLAHVLHAAQQAIARVDRGWVALLDEKSEKLIIKTTIGEDVPPCDSQISLNDGRVAPALRDRTPWLVSEESAAARSAIVAPMMVQEKVTGIIRLENTSQDEPFHARDLRLLTA
ncbi:MAG: GAF domain-containing protein, partial [Anaerolineae bacterium]|nr:GAF domain-containing protein [Anaerolineae bacterium]